MTLEVRLNVVLSRGTLEKGLNITWVYYNITWVDKLKSVACPVQLLEECDAIVD